MSKLSPEVHRKFHLKPIAIKYKPQSVRTILENLWRYTDILIDLAFYAFFAKDRELALKILDLDRLVSEYIGQFILHNSMAYGRTKEGAYASLLSFYYGSAMDSISDSVKDIVYAMLVGYAPNISYEQVLPYAEGEVVAKMPVNEDFKVIDLTDKYPVDVLLVVEGGEYRFSPQPREAIRRGSVLYIRGFRDVVMRLLSDQGIEHKLEYIDVEGFDRVAKNLVEIKDCTTLMLNLAHYVLMEFAKELVEEVEDLEIHIDWLHLETMNQLNSLATRVDPSTITGIITLLKELEDIADASASMSRILSLQEEFPDEYKAIFSRVFKSLNERVKAVTLAKSTDLQSLAYYLKKYGGQVLAVKTRDTWVAYPLAREVQLSPGDKVILVYQEEFTEEVENLLASLARPPK
ncbi:MAG: PhoU domain-containing protein [Desulfurococcaceae archaeon]